ncbi:Coronin-2B [Globomyces sp. JEL0801]|nr:Coronin-2B [Globomyces sp. JEL0801]
MSKFVRASKYRHTFGTAAKRDQCYDNLKVSKSAWDTNLASANPLFIAVNLDVGGGGAFAVIPHAMVGKLPENLPVFNGHAGAVLDTDFNPFNDHVIASASEDCKAMVWTIPEGGLTESINTPTVALTGHGRKVGHVLFNPVADNILATTSADFLVKIWDITTGQAKIDLQGHGELIQSISWSYEGLGEAPGHQGIKGSRVVTLGDSSYLCTTGFSRTSDRQIYIWDYKNLSTPIKQENIDTSSGLLIPYYDADTKMIYVAGKGDGNIRYYEWVEEDKNIYELSEYKSSDPLRGIAFLPKRACTINETEVARIYKVHPTMVEPISMKVPRKSDLFQSDLFPDTAGPEPAMSANEWFNGKTCGPKLINLELGFTPAPAKEFVVSASAAVSAAASPASGNPPLSDKEVSLK